MEDFKPRGPFQLKKTWKKLNQKIVHKNPWFNIRQDFVVKPNNSKSDYFVLEIPQAVFAVALTYKQEVYLVLQYRYPTDRFSWEVPGGRSDDMDPLEAAKKELQEETGLIADTWQKVGDFQTMKGIANEISNVFLARGLIETEEHTQKEEGILEVKKVPFKKSLEMIKSGEITDGQTIAALTQVGLYLKLL
ncbi:NUDIX hydrolase [Candidatus Daviesbacteria bacterium]|nr:NUDIX hydrolase [Candidatus Daviesbacteria bacterium]